MTSIIHPLPYVVLRFYIDSWNYVYMYDMKLKVKLLRETKDSGVKRKSIGECEGPEIWAQGLPNRQD